MEGVAAAAQCAELWHTLDEAQRATAAEHFARAGLSPPRPLAESQFEAMLGRTVALVEGLVAEERAARGAATARQEALQAELLRTTRAAVLGAPPPEAPRAEDGEEEGEEEEGGYDELSEPDPKPSEAEGAGERSPEAALLPAPAADGGGDSGGREEETLTPARPATATAPAPAPAPAAAAPSPAAAAPAAGEAGGLGPPSPPAPAAPTPARAPAEPPAEASPALSAAGDGASKPRPDSSAEPALPPKERKSLVERHKRVKMVQTMFDKYAKRDEGCPAGAMGRKELSQLSKDSGSARIDSAYYRDTCEALRADPEVGLSCEHLALLYIDNGAWAATLEGDYKKIFGTRRVKSIAPPAEARPQELNAFLAGAHTDLDDV